MTTPKQPPKPHSFAGESIVIGAAHHPRSDP